MKKIITNPADERNIRHLKETIDLLRKEKNKLKLENTSISSLKETIKKLKKEKLELSQKIIGIESESLLNNASKDNKDDILLYNPKAFSKKFLNYHWENQIFLSLFSAKKMCHI